MSTKAEKIQAMRYLTSVGMMNPDWKTISGAVDEIVQMIQSESPRPDWTPCAEGLPKKDGAYDVTVKSAFGKLMLLPGYFRDGAWWNCPYSEHIIAWKPKPEPYNPDRKEDANSDDVSQWPEWKQRAALSNYKFENSDHIREPAKEISEELTPCKACGCNYVITWEHHCIPPHRFYCQCAKCKQKTSEHENKELAKQEWNKMQEERQ